MNKLLKSLLISTASIGAIAGTTAAVVSCGESTPTLTPEQQLMNKWVDYVNSNVNGSSKFGISLTTVPTLTSLEQAMIEAWINSATGNQPTDFIKDLQTMFPGKTEADITAALVLKLPDAKYPTAADVGKTFVLTSKMEFVAFAKTFESTKSLTLTMTVTA